MEVSKNVFIKRSSMDRRSPIDRRIINLGPRYPNMDKREHKDRRIGWEDRYGWERSSRWSSTPLYQEIP